MGTHTNREDLAMLNTPSLGSYFSGIGRIRDWELLKKVFSESRNALPSIHVPGNFYANVERGRYNREELRQKLIKSGIVFFSGVYEFFGFIDISPELVEEEIWEVSGEDMGLRGIITYEDYFQRLSMFRLKPISYEAMMLAALDWKDENCRLGGMISPLAQVHTRYCIDFHEIKGKKMLYGVHKRNDLQLSARNKLLVVRYKL